MVDDIFLCFSPEPPNSYTNHVSSGLLRQNQGNMFANTYQCGSNRPMMQMHPQPLQAAAMSANPIWPTTPNLSLDSLRMNTSGVSATVSHSNGASMQQQQQMHPSSAYSGGAGDGTSSGGNNSLPQLSMGDLECLNTESQGGGVGQIRQENQVPFARKAAAPEAVMMQSHWGSPAQQCSSSSSSSSAMNGGMGYTSFLENMGTEGDFLQSFLQNQQSSVALPKQEQPAHMMAQAPATSECQQQSYTTLLSCPANNGAAHEAMRQVVGKAANGPGTIDQDTLDNMWYYPE